MVGVFFFFFLRTHLNTCHMFFFFSNCFLYFGMLAYCTKMGLTWKCAGDFIDSM